MIFHNGLKYRYHFIIKELANEYKGEFNCLGEKILRNKKTFSFSEVKKKNLKKVVKAVKKLLNLYLIKQNFLTAQDSWQAHYQILSIILPKKFIKLNVQTAISAG